MADLLTPLAIVLVGIVLSVAAVKLPSRGARKRVSRARAGKTVRVPCLLRGTGRGHPPDFDDGVLSLGEGAPGWHSLEARGRPLDLSRCRRIRVRPVTPDDGLPDDSEVCELRAPGGALVELAVEPGEADLVAAAFPEAIEVEDLGPSETYDPVLEPPAVRAGGGVLLALGLITGSAVAALWFTARPVPAVVTGAGGNGCAITWSDPWNGSAREGDIGCTDVSAGRPVEVLALRVPQGVAVRPSTVGLFLLVPALLLAGSLLRRRAGRDDEEPAWQSDAGRSSEPGPSSGRTQGGAVPLSRRELPTYDRVVEVVSARAEAERWVRAAPSSRRRRDRYASWPKVPPLRRQVLGTAVGMVPLVVVFGLLPAYVGFRWWAPTWTLMASDSAVAPATVSGAARPPLPATPAVVPVTFEVGGTVVRTVVGAASVPPPGTVVPVEYAVAAPKRARLVDGDRATIWAGGSAAALAAALLIAVMRTGAAVGHVRGLTRSLRSRGRAIRYVLFVDGDDEVGALVYPDEDRYGRRDALPAVVVALAEDVVGAVPLFGPAEVHGRPSPGEPVVVRVGDVVLWPAYVAEQADLDLVRDLVNGAD